MDVSNWVPVAFALAAFASVFMAAVAIGLHARRKRFRRRLETLDANPLDPAADAERGWVESMVRMSGPLARLTLPSNEAENTALRLKFVQAGWRNPSAQPLFFVLKIVLALGLPLLAIAVCQLLPDALSASETSLVASLAGLVGLYAPSVTLKAATDQRKRELFEAFPDALDLMTVCMEAGLSLEASLLRVAQEMSESQPTLAEELQLVVLEMRAGRGREEALRNLARRTGVEEIEALVATLVQAEQFGVSVANSLRVHSDLLRTKRRQRVEEAAAKIGTKLTFPLMICILPTLMIVVAGPAILGILKAFAGT